MTLLVEAAGAALDRLAATDPGAVLVTGREPGLGSSFSGAHAERWVVAPGRQARLAVAAGIAVTGRTAIVVCEDAGDVVSGPWDLGGRLVAVTDADAVATAAWEAGIRVAVPAWDVDLATVLAGSHVPAAPAAGSVCVFLHPGAATAAPPLALDPFSLDEHRIVTHGDAARIGVAGHLVAPALEAAWHLARRERPITVVQFTCLRADDPSPREATAGMFWDTGAGWEAVPLGKDDPGHIVENVLARLAP